MLEHVIWLDATGDSATIVGKTIANTGKKYEVFFASSDCIMNMAESLDLKSANTMNTPDTREAWGPRSGEYAGRENHAVFRSVLEMLLWLSF